MTWPLFKSLMFFLETVLARPRFLPALLTDVIPFQRSLAGTAVRKLVKMTTQPANLGSVDLHLLKKFVELRTEFPNRGCVGTSCSNLIKALLNLHFVLRDSFDNDLVTLSSCEAIFVNFLINYCIS